MLHAPDLFDLDDEGHAQVLSATLSAGRVPAACGAEGGCPEHAITITAEENA
jgi:ferredoxin